MGDNKKLLLGVGIVAFFVVFSKFLSPQEETEEEEEKKIDNKSDNLEIYPEGCKANNIEEIKSLHVLFFDEYLEKIGQVSEAVEVSDSLEKAYKQAKEELSTEPLTLSYKGLLDPKKIDQLCWLSIRFGMKANRTIEADLSRLEEGIINLGALKINGFDQGEEGDTTLKNINDEIFKGNVKTILVLKDKKVVSGSEEEKRYNETSDFILKTFGSDDLQVLLDVEYPEY